MTDRYSPAPQNEIPRAFFARRKTCPNNGDGSAVIMAVIVAMMIMVADTNTNAADMDANHGRAGGAGAQQAQSEQGRDQGFHGRLSFEGFSPRAAKLLK
jgi:hypothetical protein